MVNVAWRSIPEIIASTFLPARCILCGAAVRTAGAPAIDLCSACVAELPFSLRACTICAEPLPIAAPRDSICGQCLRKRPRYHASVCAFRFGYPVDHLVRAFKFHGRLAYGRVLATLLAAALRDSREGPWPEIIIPVPLAEARFRERGFNQAIELGRIVEARLGIPLRPDLAVRKRMTREQTGLKARERRKNVRDAFAMRSKLPARHVAILDDVITTGSTANELARILRRAGAKRVEVWAVARTPR